jgi:hypothetical protein
MGAGKLKKAQRQKDFLLTRKLARPRFDLYALGTRRAMARVLAEELLWWSDPDEKVIGLVFRDRPDDDYGWIMLARDRIGRFRCVKIEASQRSEDYATTGLRVAIAQTIANEDIAELGFQAGEPNEPFDLLRIEPGADESKLHPYFREFRDRPGRAPARAIAREIRTCVPGALD